MMKILSIPVLLALTAASPSGPTVQVATGDWSKLPLLQRVSYANLSSTIMSKLYEIGRQHKCQLPGQRKRHLDMSLSFAAQFTPDGKLSRLLVPQLNCPEAEAWLGGTLVKSIQHGDFRPDAKVRSRDGWYRGNFSFYYEV